MPALVAGIYVLRRGDALKTWMAGTSLDEPGHDVLPASQNLIMSVLVKVDFAESVGALVKVKTVVRSA